MKSRNSLYLIIQSCFRWSSSNSWKDSVEPQGFDRTQVKNHCFKLKLACPGRFHLQVYIYIHSQNKAILHFVCILQVLLFYFVYLLQVIPFLFRINSAGITTTRLNKAWHLSVKSIPIRLQTKLIAPYYGFSEVITFWLPRRKVRTIRGCQLFTIACMF